MELRLNVLRGVLTETITLEKQSQGIKSNKQLFKLLEKRKNASIRAANEFKAAGREDLTVKENEQISVLQSYLDTFDVLTADETVAAVEGIVRFALSKGAPPKKETVRVQLFRPATEDRAEGPLCEKIVDERLVTQTIDRLIAEVASQHGSLAKART
ncbi:MAG: hypothetical protein L6R37_000898 [Teloschistes peruensis]|nr:MAG: hypothetical protein L6R37_000898 [Teloschistes peruensis]